LSPSPERVPPRVDSPRATALAIFRGTGGPPNTGYRLFAGPLVSRRRRVNARTSASRARFGAPRRWAPPRVAPAPRPAWTGVHGSWRPREPRARARRRQPRMIRACPRWRGAWTWRAPRHRVPVRWRSHRVRPSGGRSSVRARRASSGARAGGARVSNDCGNFQSLICGSPPSQMTKQFVSLGSFATSSSKPDGPLWASSAPGHRTRAVPVSSLRCGNGNATPPEARQLLLALSEFLFTVKATRGSLPNDRTLELLVGRRPTT
jgi:hypothetical protein